MRSGDFAGFGGEIAIKAIRGMIWEVYEFFEDGCHLKDNAEEEFERLLPN